MPFRRNQGDILQGVSLNTKLGQPKNVDLSNYFNMGEKVSFWIFCLCRKWQNWFWATPTLNFLVGWVSSWQSNGETISLCSAAGTCVVQSLPGAGTVGGTAWWFPQQCTWDGEVGAKGLWGTQGCSLVLSSLIGVERVIETSKIFPWLCWSILVGSMKAGRLWRLFVWCAGTARRPVPSCSPPEVSGPFHGCNQVNESCKVSLTYTWTLTSN